MEEKPPRKVAAGIGASINDLPEVVLEYILLQLSPYSDLHACSQVNRLWNLLAKRAMVKIRRNLEQAVQNQQLQWFTRPIEEGEIGASYIQKRHSHSCVVLGRRMYVFGGCTSNTSTTYNDLWSYDLARRVWVKPLSYGTYPPPKACASLITHQNKLILFGGWAHTSPYYPLYNSWRIFDHIHTYDPAMNCWTEVNRMATSGCCPATAGHTASLFREDKMLLFGGLQALDDGRGPPYNMSNDVWLLNLKSWMWSKQKIQGAKPKPRYGHSQIALDEDHILIIGGCSGPDEMLYDLWLLEACSRNRTSDNLEWKWYPIEVANQKDGAPRLSFHPACRVGDWVVMLGRSRYGAKSVPQASVRVSHASPLRARPANGDFMPGPSRLDRGPPGGAVAAQGGAAAGAVASPTHAAGWKSTMSVYALDISESVVKKRACWVERAEAAGRVHQPPEHLVLYTLVKGQGELLMFGGIRRESCAGNSEVPANSDNASNDLYSLSFTQEVI